jgi:hypothetical protein
MNTLRIRRKLESETLYLPELKPLIGKNVDIIVALDDIVSRGGPNVEIIARLRSKSMT